MKKLLVIFTLFLSMFAFGQWYDFIGNLQFDANTTVPSQSRGMMFYHSILDSIGYYNNTGLVELKDDAERKNLISNSVGDAEFVSDPLVAGYSEAGSGTLSMSTVGADQLNGTRVFTFAPAAVNDLVYFPTITVPQIVNTTSISIGYEFRYKYDGDDDDLQVRAYCAAPSFALLLGADSDGVSLYKDTYKATGVVNVPKDCTEIRLGVETVVYNSGKTLLFDDLKLSDNPYVYKNLTEKSLLRMENQSRGTGAEAFTGYWSVVNEQSGSGITLDNTNGTLLKIAKAGTLHLSATAATSGTLYITKNDPNPHTTPATSVTIQRHGVFSGSGYVEVSAEFSVEVGDIIRVAVNTPSSLADAHLNAILYTEAEHVVHASNIEDLIMDFAVKASSAGTLSKSDGAEDWVSFSSKTTGTYNYVLNTEYFSEFPKLSSETINTDIFASSVNYGTFPNFSVKVRRVDNNAIVDTIHEIKARKAGADLDNSRNFFVAIPTEQNENNFSAKVDSSGVVSDAVGDFITGSAVVSDSSLFTINFASGFFTSPPNVTVVPLFALDSRAGTAYVVYVSNTSVVVRVGYTYASGTFTKSPLDGFSIAVQRSGSDYKPQTGIVTGKFAKTRVANVMGVKDQNVDAVVGVNTIPISAITGDTEFSSLSLNQITLTKGKYLFDLSMSLYQTNHSYMVIHDGTSDILFGNTIRATYSEATSATVQLKAVHEFFVDTTIEIRINAESAKAAGLGNVGRESRFTGTITKLR